MNHGLARLLSPVEDGPKLEMLSLVFTHGDCISETTRFYLGSYLADFWIIRSKRLVGMDLYREGSEWLEASCPVMFRSHVLHSKVEGRDLDDLAGTSFVFFLRLPLSDSFIYLQGLIPSKDGRKVPCRSPFYSDSCLPTTTAPCRKCSMSIRIVGTRAVYQFVIERCRGWIGSCPVGLGNV